MLREKYELVHNPVVRTGRNHCNILPYLHPTLNHTEDEVTCEPHAVPTYSS